MSSKIDIAAVLQYYGAGTVPVSHRWASIRCPLHDDSTASASVNTEEGKFRCFACQVRGDGLDVIMHAENIGFVEAKKFAEGLGLVVDSPEKQQSREGRRRPFQAENGQQSVMGKRRPRL